MQRSRSILSFDIRRAIARASHLSILFERIVDVEILEQLLEISVWTMGLLKRARMLLLLLLLLITMLRLEHHVIGRAIRSISGRYDIIDAGTSLSLGQTDTGAIGKYALARRGRLRLRRRRCMMEYGR